MGVFWRIASNNYRSLQALVLQERKGTISGDVPFLWRLGQYRYLLEVTGDTYRKGYYLYSYTEKDKTLRFHEIIHTKYVVVPVGPDKIDYWAEDRNKVSMPIICTGLKIAGPLVRGADAVTKKFLKHHVPAEELTWT